jgi:hypothetical protein
MLDYGLRITDYGLRITDYGLRITDYTKVPYFFHQKARSAGFLVFYAFSRF